MTSKFNNPKYETFEIYEKDDRVKNISFRYTNTYPNTYINKPEENTYLMTVDLGQKFIKTQDLSNKILEGERMLHINLEDRQKGFIDLIKSQNYDTLLYPESLIDVTHTMLEKLLQIPGLFLKMSKKEDQDLFTKIYFNGNNVLEQYKQKQENQ